MSSERDDVRGPGVHQSGTRPPGTRPPGTRQSGSQAPDTEAPGTQAPDTEAPDAHAPGKDLVSQREACEMLRSRTHVDRETARRVLKAGLAGRPVTLRGTLLHQRESVEALAQRPLLGPWLPETCRRGTFVARLGPRRAVTGEPGEAVAEHEVGRLLAGRRWRGADVLAPESEQRAAAGGPWRLSALARVKLRLMVERQGFVPFVATVGGFVVLGAEVADVTPLPGRPGEHPTVLSLRAPGDWFEAWHGGRLPTAPGGPWQMWPAGLWQLASTP